MAREPEPTTQSSKIIHRHSWITRLWHWINVLCLLVLLMSGLQIFNAHPALYWGHRSHFNHPLMAIGAQRTDAGKPMGYVAIDGTKIPTTGVLGLSWTNGQMQVRAFPEWATLPGPQWLALGRQWHFIAAWVFGILLVLYLAYSLISRRRRRLLAPHASELRDIGHVATEHARFHFPRLRHYNIIQKLSYNGVLFIVLPLIVLSGLTMSPTMDSAWPWLTLVFDGRQSARTIHFICAFLLITFFVVHLLLVLFSGPLNNLRCMISGGYRIDHEESHRHAE